MKKTAFDFGALQFGETQDGTITIMGGDIDFQSTLTELEKKYIHEGQNWISKLSRETDLKSLHNIGYTLDDTQNISDEERSEIWKRANETWNNMF